ncbi:hypothetical protein ABZ920_01730 [Streptomyces sp. NPDC046831]|uniref:hypothetical protein n=1 Tax=Streptomyces sp. NPDC046831 TaxID=3154805 RepID=UPI0033DEF150
MPGFHTQAFSSYQLPSRARGEAFAVLRCEATANPQAAPFREQIGRACERTARALRDDAPETEEPGRAA